MPETSEELKPAAWQRKVKADSADWKWVQIDPNEKDEWERLGYEVRALTLAHPAPTAADTPWQQREAAAREQIETALHALDIPEHKLNDVTFLRGSIMTAKAFIRAALTLAAKEMHDGQ